MLIFQSTGYSYRKLRSLIVAAGCGKQVALKATIKLHCIRVKEKEAIGVQGLGFKVQGSKVQGIRLQGVRDSKVQV
jgi:hypothetical protein